MKVFLALTAMLIFSLGLTQASLSVSPQDLKGSTVTINASTLEEDGFIVVHAFDTEGELVLTPPLGVTYLAAGSYTNVDIELNAALLEENGYNAEPKNVLPMIHVDANANQVYEFPEGGDVPVMVNNAMVIAELPIRYSAMMMDSSIADAAPFSVDLTGAQEVPPVMTEASGSALVRLNGNRFAISGRFQNLSSPIFPIAGTAAHIHMGALGENGAAVILLSVSANQDGLRGVFSGEAELTEEQLTAFNAGQFYLNLHTEMNQGGELRAQLVPQGMLMEMMNMSMMDENMSDMSMMMPSVIYATSNPAEINNDAIYGLSPELTEAFLTFNGFAEAVTSVESVAFAADGTAYLTVDTADGGVLVGVPDLGNMTEGIMLSNTEMMMMPGLTAPKGLQVVNELGLVLVADFGAKAIVVYDRDLQLMGSVTDLGGERSVWDVYHDTASDTLYAAGTDGVLLVYEGFTLSMGAEGPSRTIIPSDSQGNKLSINLHGLAYYAPNDEIILSDVGDAANATDGQLFVIPNVSMSSGNTTVSVQIAGPASMLGNPVDVVYDGTYTYVAEKSNDAVLRFDNLLAMDMMGMMGDCAPSAMISVSKAESVALPAHSMMDGM